MLPRGGAGFTIEGGDIDRTIAGAALTRTTDSTHVRIAVAVGGR